MKNSKDQYTQLQECTALEEYRQHREPERWRDEEGDNPSLNEKINKAYHDGYKKGWEEGAEYGYGAAHEGR